MKTWTEQRLEGMCSISLVDYSDGTVTERLATVEEFAARVNAQVVPSLVNDVRPHRCVVFSACGVVDGVPSKVSAQVCECHDGYEATVGNWPDPQQQIAQAAGAAVRAVFPQDTAAIGAAEALLDVAQALA